LCPNRSCSGKARACAQKACDPRRRLIDGKTDAPIANALILIEGDKIVSVTPGGTLPREWN